MDSTGRFSVKSIFRSLCSSVAPSVLDLSVVDWSLLWKLKFHARLKLLLWKVAWNILPTRARIAEGLTSQLDLVSLCPLCVAASESLHHLLLACPLSRLAWRESRWNLNTMVFLDQPFSAWLKVILQPNVFLGLSPAALWMCIPFRFLR